MSGSGRLGRMQKGLYPSSHSLLRLLLLNKQLREYIMSFRGSERRFAYLYTIAFLENLRKVILNDASK